MSNERHPRRPTAHEIEQLVAAVAEERTEYMPSEEEFQEARDLVSKACIAVFDSYAADGSTHEEKLISVVWNIGRDYYEVYLAKDGYVEYVPQNEVLAEE